ncbi:hypothetical protein REC12_08465 [Desulfosporosinus sp. PR]|uniref:hypothetical protein n=1 Tax=Candidatus Desulfosporosinus nitrosoreducens TaxID=3401928 RepID=UPI0027EAC478|nr:hypothetical protein [Desulfosporosinus sp. PR]MDQ7093620.1 hypothetical protein [Desulfosporosinus sp. PR]
MITLKSKTLLKEALLVLFELLIIFSLGYYASRPINNNIYEKGLGITLLLLFVISPLMSFFFGFLTEKLRVLTWINVVVLTLLYLGLFSYFYNYTAYFYIPFYLIIYFIGLILRRIASKANSIKD